jgi:hypothetical protein
VICYEAGYGSWPISMEEVDVVVVVVVEEAVFTHGRR